MMWTAVPLIRVGPSPLEAMGYYSYSYSRLLWAMPG
jgi:hypothetical protein